MQQAMEEAESAEMLTVFWTSRSQPTRRLGTSTERRASGYSPSGSIPASRRPDAHRPAFCRPVVPRSALPRGVSGLRLWSYSNWPLKDLHEGLEWLLNSRSSKCEGALIRASS
ncbi:unnamed protein product [Cuscuta europaea]|uniref:Uncharacterized protein n=1 Tax=Cuscuta europaea TaxID=41803 RepID=A0A9P1E2U6_CUSEU|nr:unnamed protein product [Cuscuta europaea]